MIKDVHIEGEELLRLIPQRSPMVMIDRFFLVENEASGGLSISPDNQFFANGQLEAEGVIEHIAQVAAARAGYHYTHVMHQPIPLGFIASVDKLSLYHLPTAGETLCTRISVIQEVGDITLIAATSHCNGREVAKCRMKIFLKKE